MEALLRVDPVTSNKNLRGLRRLHNDVETHIQSLHALKVSSAAYSSMPVPVLLNKLPLEVHLIVSRKTVSTACDVEMILDAVEKELTAREHPPNYYSHRQQERYHSTSTTLLTDTSAPHTAVLSCCYC